MTVELTNRARGQDLARAASSGAFSVAGAAAVVGIYALTIFVSATMLFMVQPMFARMVLPLLGGAPAVWNTTVVFYQAILLVGYLYAHLTTTRLGVRRGAALHAGLLLAPLLVLPIALPGGWTPPTEANPIPWLLALLAVAVGLPFFVVSTSSPLIQAWFARTGHRSAADPYMLYAASNAGSMLALLTYPVLIEPRLGLEDQSRLWAAGYILLVALTLACAATVWRRAGASAGAAREVAEEERAAGDARLGAVTARRRLRWLLLAFVPSSLMLSVTTYFTTNIAPVPLLWVIPLAIYLLTFILVFANRTILPQGLLLRAFPLVLLPLAVLMVAHASRPVWLLAGLHLACFFLAAMLCHGAMAADRPAPRRLTEFYLWMSAGGVLGGLFNALLAPVLFDSIAEYPLALVLACLLLPWPASAKPVQHGWRRWLGLAMPLGVGALVAALIAGVPALDLPAEPLNLALIFGPPAVLCFSLSRRPARFALGVAAIFLVSGALYTSGQGRVLHAERSFFGIHRIMLDPTGRYHMLAHGGTNHGIQSVDPALAREPLAYYYRTGPIGQVFAAQGSGKEGGADRRRVATIGLGAGALACYARPGQDWTFYELDPSVARIARDPRYFTYLRDCAPESRIVLGDGRLSLAGAPDGYYDLLVLDAYSSDTVPVHLLTREALALYGAKLAPGGVLAFHISNDYLDLRPVLGNLARDAGLVAYVQADLALTEEEAAAGKSASVWVVMARTPADLGGLDTAGRWQPLGGAPGGAVWTDNFSSILSVIRWR